MAAIRNFLNIINNYYCKNKCWKIKTILNSWNIHKLEIIKFIGLMQNINVNNKRKYKKTNKVKHQRFKVTTKGLLCRRSSVRYLLLTIFSFPWQITTNISNSKNGY